MARRLLGHRASQAEGFERAFSDLSGQFDSEAAKALARAGRARAALGQASRAVQQASDAEALARRFPSPLVRVEVLTQVGAARAELGQPAEAERCLDEARALLRGIDLPAEARLWRELNALG